jgi:hypothetical protein
MSENLHRNNAAEIAMHIALLPLRFLLFVFIRANSWIKSG